jgi:hypothetical protein
VPGQAPRVPSGAEAENTASWDSHRCDSLYIVVLAVVRPVSQVGRRKRESGANPELPRSGEWERPPSEALGRILGSDGQ